MKTKTMLDLKVEMDVGVVIRYKDFVLSVDFYPGDWFEVEVWRPVETEEETGEDFMNLRLENVTEWENQRFDTEGEALKAGFEFIDWKF